VFVGLLAGQTSHVQSVDQVLLSFFLLCREMLPSTLRPLMDPVRNFTSPNGLKLL